MPVGPEFQDPPTPENQKPYFVAPLAPDGPPFYEQTVTLSGMRRFVAIVGDANLTDTLTVRWVANYPPVSAATHLIIDDTVDRGGNLQGSSMQTVSCDDFMGGADHNLVVIVSDQGFLDPKTFSQNPSTFQNQVPYNFDNEQPPQLIASMTGWRIAGCTQ